LEVAAIQLQTQRVRAIELEAQAAGGKVNAGDLAKKSATENKLYGHNGMKDVLNATVRHRSLYLGGGPLLLRNLLWFTATFGGFYQAKAFAARISLGDDSKTAQANLSVGWKIFAGSVSGVFAWSSSFPLEVIKANIMAQPLDRNHRTYTSALDCAQKLYAEGGVPRLFRGLTPCIARAAPAFTIVLNTYDYMRYNLGLTE